MEELNASTKVPEDFIEDTKAIIDRYLGYVTKAHRKQRSFYFGFAQCINGRFFPLLSEEELVSFRKEYEELVNRLFPKQ